MPNCRVLTVCEVTQIFAVAACVFVLWLKDSRLWLVGTPVETDWNPEIAFLLTCISGKTPAGHLGDLLQNLSEL